MGYVGDFNTVRNLGEMNYLRKMSNTRKYISLLILLNNYKMLNIPMIGIKYTWYKPN